MACSDFLFQPEEIFWVVFLHHAKAIRAAEVEDVMRILLKQREVVMQSGRQIFLDDLGILPSPLRIQVRVRHHKKSRLLSEVIFFLRRWRFCCALRRTMSRRLTKRVK